MGTSPEVLATSLTAVNITALVLAVTITALRCYVRIRLLKAFGPDDWLMVAAVIFFAFYCAFSLAGVSNGTGYHVDQLSKEAYAEAKKWWYCCYPTYAITMMLTKMSMALFFRRVIVERMHHWILMAASVLTILTCVVFFFACIFQCWPVSFWWDKYSQDGYCVPDKAVLALGFLFSIINIVTDFTFALMPAWILSHLNMRRRVKVTLYLLMGLGCIASAAVVARLPYLQYLSSPDFLYDTVPVAIWSTVEQCLAISAGGLATLQPLLKQASFKLGFGPRPSIPGQSRYKQQDGQGGTAGSIAVKRSFARTTEVRTSAHERGDPNELRLQPMVGEYSAECYNTSEEFLRLPSPDGMKESSEGP
ncbi:hypothetical protein B0J18DRAFT_71249 [Chaetomium sp. MPI-SDFR-AT-0129]|nr:hypothetical protein B0J18DRAFT_71249 [Chaetomium sp. MPI-SDFR-AT-0129]